MRTRGRHSPNERQCLRKERSLIKDDARANGGTTPGRRERRRGGGREEKGRAQCEGEEGRKGVMWEAKGSRGMGDGVRETAFGALEVA